MSLVDPGFVERGAPKGWGLGPGQSPGGAQWAKPTEAPRFWVFRTLFMSYFSYTSHIRTLNSNKN